MTFRERVLLWRKELEDSIKLDASEISPNTGDATSEEADNNEQQVEQTEKLEELVDECIKVAKENSEHPNTVECDDKEWERAEQDEYEKNRKDFADKTKKDELIKAWEQKNGKEWPRYEKDVYSKSGKLIRKAGGRYDAHHIRPLRQGGKNEVGNITPMHAEKHYDKQGIHAKDGPYDKVDEHLKGANKNEAS